VPKKEKRQRRREGGREGRREGGREEMHRSYAREQDLRELNRAERSGVILHNDG